MCFLHHAAVAAVYTDLLQPEDDFFMRCRKAVIAAVFVAATLVLILQVATVDTELITKLGYMIDYLVTLLICLHIIAIWGFAKYTRTAPDWLMNLFWDIPLVLLIIMNFCSHSWCMQAFYMAIAVSIILLNAPHLSFQLCACAVLYSLNLYDTFHQIGFPSYTFPGSIEPTFLPLLQRQVCAAAACVGAMWCINTTKDQFCLLITKSIGALRIVRDITKKLVVYDTEGALALLVSAQSDGALDPEFVAALTKMLNNLDRYRPHLPRAVLLAAEDMVEEEIKEGVEQIAPCTAVKDQDFPRGKK